jgi:serine/threonine-protein kinase
LLEKEGPLEIARGVEILLQVCDALKAAHAQGVIHRDLKPANVILREGKHAVVVDFGMAKIVTGGATGTTALTTHNMVFGTPEYMSPEQARGDELDARCDVYAVGVMLYQLLTGSVPFSGPTPLSVLTAHLTMDPTPPREKAPTRGISPSLEAVVMHALAKDPMKRYATAAALSAAVVHARAVPDDIAAVGPTAFALGKDDGPDAHAETLPGPAPTDPSALKPRHASGPASGTSLSLGAASGMSRRAWALVWLVAAVSVSVGIWLAMRG